MGREHFSGPIVSNEGIDVGDPSERWTMLDSDGLFYLLSSTQALAAVTAAAAGTIKLQYTSSGVLVLATSDGAVATIDTSTI
jgi:hypothetical protein